MSISVAPMAPAAASVAPTQDKRHTARDFEAVMIGETVKAMFEASSDTPPGGSAELMFRGILAEQIGLAQAAQGGLGIKDAVVAAMRQREGEQ